MKYEDESVRNKVYECAEELLYSHGVKGWNMGVLAADTGLARPTLYKIIGSKEKLIEKIAINHIRQNNSKLKAFVLNEGDWSTKEATIESLKKCIGVWIDNMDIFEPIILPQIYREFPAIEPTVLSQIEGSIQELIDSIEQGKKLGFIREYVDPEAVVEAAQIILRHYIRGNKDKSEFKERASRIFDYFITGIFT